LAFRLTGNDDDAREVCQETYLRAYRAIRRFRGDARFTTWLHRITVNCASSHLGRRRRHRHDRLDGLDDHAPIAELIDTVPAHDPVGRAEHADLRARVRTALGGLPPKLRAVVVLRDIYDLTHDEIATELGISVAAAKVRLHRARRRLRDELFLIDTDAVGEGPSARAAAGAVTASIQGRRRRSKGGGDVDPRPL
jgi:RNA polymerase sigma-70 factor (ECF subfamily)